MSSPVEQLGALASPTQLMALVGDPAEMTSPAIVCALDAMYATPNPTRAQLALWRTIAPSTLLGLVSAPWPNRPYRRVVACIGRRGLKTSGLLATACVYETLCVPHDAHAAAGSRIYSVIICPLVAQAREAMRGVRAVLDKLAPLGVQYEIRDVAGAPEIVITNPMGSCERVVAVMTADAVSVRGFAVAFVALDEGGHLPSASYHATTDKDIERAVSAAMIQFPDARTLWCSTPGPPSGRFHALVEKPDADTLVIRAPTWVANPRITEQRCRREAVDEHTFAQEFAVRKFGYSGEHFVHVENLKLGSKFCGLGPRHGSFVIALDIGQILDATRFGVFSGFDDEINPAHAPVRHVVCEHLDGVEASRKNPVPIEAIAARVASLSAQYSDAPVVFDAFAGPTIKQELVKLGFTEHEDKSTVPSPRTFMQMAMDPPAQTARWKALRDAVHGGRLHLPEGREAEAARAELGSLTATELSSGALKVEAREDDRADVLNLGFDIAKRLPSTGGTGGTVTWTCDGLLNGPDGVRPINPRWVRTLPDGRVIEAECPEYDPLFPQYARAMIARGILTPSVQRFFDKQQQAALRARTAEDENRLSFPVRGG